MATAAGFRFQLSANCFTYRGKAVSSVLVRSQIRDGGRGQTGRDRGQKSTQNAAGYDHGPSILPISWDDIRVLGCENQSFGNQGRIRFLPLAIGSSSRKAIASVSFFKASNDARPPPARSHPPCGILYLAPTGGASSTIQADHHRLLPKRKPDGKLC